MWPTTVPTLLLDDELRIPIPSPRSVEDSRKIAAAKYGIRSLQDIISAEYPEKTPLVEHFLSPGETALLIARQKEGKSMLALQLAVDVSRGDGFLDHYATRCTPVLYIDYENRPYRIKDRAIDVTRGRTAENIHLLAFDRISDRNVGLVGAEFQTLHHLVSDMRPGLLVIDPLRYALQGESAEERVMVDAIDHISRLSEQNPALSVLLVHHLKKAQDNTTTELRSDPRAWIDRVYGSQALIAHVETIWGLEHDEQGYAFGTVSRSEDSFVIGLEKEPDSQRFTLSPTSVQVQRMTPAVRTAWDQLPGEFSRTQGVGMGIANNTLDRLIRHALAAGILSQDTATRVYRKRAGAQQAESVRNVGT
jgi:hypothetical protein